MRVNLSASPPITGGFFGDLPKDLDLPSWGYRSAGGEVGTFLLGSTGRAGRRLQIDCYGNTAAQAMKYAAVVHAALQGFRGALPDPDSTLVDICLLTDREDFFDDGRRTYRRMLEYEIHYFVN